MKTQPILSYSETELSQKVASAKEAVQSAQADKTFESIRNAQLLVNELPYDSIKEKLQETISYALLECIKNEEEETFKRLLCIPWSELQPRQKDFVVARFLMDEKPGVNVHTMMPTSTSYPPPYTTSWDAVFKVLDKLKDKGEDFFEDVFGDCLQRSTTPPCYGNGRDHRSIGELMFKISPETIVLAALRACDIAITMPNNEVEPC